ncbi:hypothetical protein EDD85DRAFT_436929 [Armillaria nabsnona]|nr:hypothetical protein EDD85DRAFT_436929 [Armillaria nabsnona]
MTSSFVRHGLVTFRYLRPQNSCRFLLVLSFLPVFLIYNAEIYFPKRPHHHPFTVLCPPRRTPAWAPYHEFINVLFHPMTCPPALLYSETEHHRQSRRSNASTQLPKKAPCVLFTRRFQFYYLNPDTLRYVVVPAVTYNKRTSNYLLRLVFSLLLVHNSIKWISSK